MNDEIWCGGWQHFGGVGAGDSGEKPAAELELLRRIAAYVPTKSLL